MSNSILLLETLIEEKRKEVASNLSIQDFFEIFSVENILKDKDLSYDDIVSGLVDGGDDGGIDSIYLFVNDEIISEKIDNYSDYKKGVNIEIFAFQTKFSPTFKENAVEKFNRTINDLLDFSLDIEKMKLEYKSSLINKFLLICDVIKGLITKFPKIRFHGIYSSKGSTSTIHPKVQAKASRVEEDIVGLLSDSEANFKFWGADELLSEARRQPKTVFTLDTVEGLSPDKGLYITLSKIKSYYAFITTDNKNLNKSIFESNVRDYQGSVNVNKDIKESLEKGTKEDFWWLNNGVTILASQISVSGKEVVIENPEIVNGLQTSNEIYNYYKSGGNDSERSVLIRIICPQSEDSRDKIIKATNSQTIIPSVSLRGTDKIHRDIEDYFHANGLYYDRRKNHYKNLGKPIAKIVSISYLGQSLMSILLQKPDTARARPSTLLNNDDEYKKLFADDIPLDTYLKCVIILRTVDNYLKDNNQAEISIRSDLKYYIALDVAYKLSGLKIPTKESISKINTNDINSVDIENSFDKIRNKYNELGGDNKAAKGASLIKWLLENMG